MDNSEIPAELLARLESIQHILSTNGAVVARRDRDREPAWRLRYRARGADGCSHQLSVPLPDGPVVEMVRELLAAWQDRHQLHQQAERQAARDQAQARKDQGRQRRARRRAVLALASGGRRRRKRIAALYDQAVAAGLQAEMDFCLCERYRLPNRPPGRPRQDALLPPAKRER